MTASIKEIMNEKWDQHPSHSFVFVDEERIDGHKCVGTTGFVRHRKPMKQLLATLETLPSQPLRVLSAPCSIGSEPYSFAMIAEEAGLYNRRTMHIDALDLSPRFVAAAREGLYPASMLTDSFPPEMRRHFHGAADGMVQISDAIKQRVNVLHAQDLTTLKPEKPYDALIMLNLLIQLDDGVIAARLADTVDRLSPSAILLNNVFLVKRKDGDRKVIPYEHWHMLEKVLCDNGYVTANSTYHDFPAYGKTPLDLQKSIPRLNDGTFLFVKPAPRM